jgi:ABC-type multidrug transport system permease subunit
MIERILVIFLSIQNMPVAIQAFTYLVPARYFVAVLRGIFLKGVGADVLECSPSQAEN